VIQGDSTTLWSDQPSQRQLLELAVSAEDGYDVFWLEMRRDQESQDTQLGTVPRFKRVRKIRRCAERGTLLCDCCYFDRVGIPYRHIIVLLHHILGGEFKGLSQEVYDYSIDDDGGHSFVAGDMCDVFPKMKPNTVTRVQAYEAINPHVTEMYSL
jgi:hypothetical protein